MFRLKVNSSIWLLTVAFLAAQGPKVRAQAQDRVLLVQEAGAPARPELLLALRIQLTGAAEVETAAVPDSQSTTARIESASVLAGAENALAVVWTEGPIVTQDGSQEAVLYVVGQQHGRALLEVVRVPGDSGPDMDRTLALKVREIVDALQAARAHAPGAALLTPTGTAQKTSARAAPSPTPAPSPGSSPAPSSPAAEAHWTAAAALGVLASAQAGAAYGQWGAGIGVGPRLNLAANTLRLSGMLGLALYPRTEVQKAGARVGIVEITPSLALHAQSKQGPLWLGARVGGALAFISADGRNAQGTRGVADQQLASLLFGVDAELPLGANLGVSLAVALEAHLRRQRFAVDDKQVADLSRLRPLAMLALTWSGGGAD